MRSQHCASKMAVVKGSDETKPDVDYSSVSGVPQVDSKAVGGSEAQEGAIITDSSAATIQNKANEAPDSESGLKNTYTSNGIDVESKVEEAPVEQCPVEQSPAPPASTPQPNLPRPTHQDEKMLHAYIVKAHAQVRDGTAAASSPEDQKYAEMVSQMTYLLGTVGIVSAYYNV